jgi:crotonobetaine/carnitine-CoA ligase
MQEYRGRARVMSSVLDDKAASLGDKTFVRDTGGRLSYRELSASSNRVANFLISELGVAKDDKVAVMLPNCLDYFHAQFGIAKAGAVMVPINVLAKFELLAHFLNNSDAKIIVIDREFLPLIESIAESLPNVRTLIIRDASAVPIGLKRFQFVEFNRLFEGPADTPPQLAEWYDAVDIFYTSGSTGVSKGVVLTHNHHYAFGRNIAINARFGDDETMYLCLPLYHGMGSYMTIMPMLLCGGTIALGSQFKASGWLDEVRKYGATTTWAVASMAPILLKQREKPNDADNPLRTYLFSGMPANLKTTFEKRFGLKLVETYGSTESADLAYSSWDERRPDAIGCINAKDYEVKIFDENDEEVPVGQIGECVSRCKHPFTQIKEYYKMPEETARALRNAWLHSGDLCRVDKDGWLYFVGRGKDVIRRRGENISCFELETILATHDDIIECAALPIPSDVGEDEVKVVIAPRRDAKLEFSAVLKFCEERMPKFMVPRYIEFVPELPKLPNYKIDKVAMKKAGITPNTWDARASQFMNPPNSRPTS